MIVRGKHSSLFHDEKPEVYIADTCFPSRVIIRRRQTEHDGLLEKKKPCGVFTTNLSII
jgi:hypothetical protein